MTPQPAPGPCFRAGGYFNLDLRDHLQLPNQPGRYALTVSIGDYLTEKILLEIY